MYFWGGRQTPDVSASLPCLILRAPSPMALARWLNCPQQVKNKLPFEQKSREIIDELDKICYNGKEIR